MALILAIVGFVVGVTLSRIAVLFLFPGRRHLIYWAIEDRFPFATAIVWLVTIASGLVFAYLSYLLLGR
jgi:hypothetical protein